MFGYIKPYTPELKMKEHEAFRAVYCGLCHQLGQSFSILARLTLNYDFVFLAMLYYAVRGISPEPQQGRCCVNPLQKVPLCRSDEGLCFSADLAVLMIHYKIEDNIADSGSFARYGWKFARMVTASGWKQAAGRQPEVDQVVAEMMRRQLQMEAQQNKSLDAACEPTAWALGQIAGGLVLPTDPRRCELERMGYLTGRYIYLCDAIADIERDRKTGNYNPLLLGEYSLEQAKDALYMTIGELGRQCPKMEFAYFSPILLNIVEYGMRNSADQIITKQKGGTIHAQSL